MATAKKDEAPTAVEAPADPVFETPKATVAAEKVAREHMEEVQEIQKDAFLRNHTNVPAENVTTAFATPDGDKDPESITFAMDGSSVKVVCTAKEMVFSRQDFVSVARAASAIVGAL